MGAVASSSSAPLDAAAIVSQGAAEDLADDGRRLSASTPLPADVKGPMDGEKPPMNRMDDLKESLQPYRHYLEKLRPWREFLRLSKPGSGEAKARLETNLAHYQINYAVIFLAVMVTSIIINPRCVAVICVLALVWMAFLKKNDDPSWEVIIGGVKLGATQRWMSLCLITAIALFCAVGQVIAFAASVCAVLVLAHGVLHPATALANADADEVNDFI